MSGSESGGKLAVLRQQARQAVATAPGRAIGQAAREEIEPVIRRLDQIMEAMDALPVKFQDASESSAATLRDSLGPMVEQVTSLRTSLESLPTLLAQQTDGVVAQIQGESLTMRREIEVLRGGLVTLPDALAKQVAPIVLMAERLDEVLALQRSSLAALHDESLKSFRAALDPTAQRIEAGLGALAKQARATGGALQGMKGLPGEIRQATQAARDGASRTATEIETAASRAADQIREARQGQWPPVVQVLATAVVAAGLILGGLVWLGTHGSSGLPLIGGASSKERAWDSLYQAAAPQLRQAMDQFLVNSARK